MVTSRHFAHPRRAKIRISAADQLTHSDDAIGASTQQDLALSTVRDIPQNPTRTYFGSRNYALGQGARFDIRTDYFIGFLYETTATR